MERQQEYQSLCQDVRKDKEVLLNTLMEEMEDNLKCPFFRKLRSLITSRVKPTSTTLDESSSDQRRKTVRLE